MWNSWNFSPFAKQCFVTLAVGINLVGHGTVVGYPAVLLPQLHLPDSTIKSTKEADSWIASLVGFTLMLGGVISTPIIGRLGRKKAHYAVSVTALLGWMVTILATGVEALIAGGIIQGLSFGMMSPLRSILIGEYTSPKNRGAFLTTITLSQGFGILFVHLVGSLLDWKKTALVCVFLPFISLIMTMFIPESPSWLADKKRYKECKQVFLWLRGDEEQAEVDELIQARINLERAKVNQKKNTVLDIVKNKLFYKPIVLMVHLYCLGQLAGTTIMAAYSITIVKLIMRPDVNAHFWMIVLDSQRIITNTLAVYAINKLKRRTLTFASGGLCLFIYIAIVVYVYSKINGGYDAIWLPALLINLQMFSIAIGMVPLPSVIAGEVFPLEYRSIAGTISLAAVAGTMFPVLKTFPGLVANVGIHGTYSIYAGLIAYCLVIIWFLLPETKGKTLQQIEDEFRGKPLVQQDIEEKQTLHDSQVS